MTLLAEKALAVEGLSKSDIDAEIKQAQEAGNMAVSDALESLRAEL